MGRLHIVSDRIFYPLDFTWTIQCPGSSSGLGDRHTYSYTFDSSTHPLIMPHPSVAMMEARLKGQQKGGAQGSASPNTAKNRVKKSKPKPKKKRMKFPMFSKLPAEIQQMIWGEAIQKPACHTFLYKRSRNPLFDMDLCPMPAHRDPSAFRWWREMLWSDWRKFEFPPMPRGNLLTKTVAVKNNEEPVGQTSHKSSSLANISFQTAFRRSMVDLQNFDVLTHYKPAYANVAAIDSATDLSIFEFERGVHAPALCWFEHDNRNLNIDGLDIEFIRRGMGAFKRVAVHYKKSHTNASGHGPFQCCCPIATQPDCYQYKACPNEQACFLDCFPNLEQFYYVVDVSRKKEIAWKAEYKSQFSHPQT